jgi:hypothetical protein
MGKHDTTNAPGTAAQKARENRQSQHESSKTAKDTGHVGTHRSRDGHETER